MADFCEITSVTRFKLCDSPRICLALQQEFNNPQHGFVDDEFLTFTLTLSMSTPEMYGAHMRVKVGNKEYSYLDSEGLVKALKPKGQRLWAASESPVSYHIYTDGDSIVMIKYWRRTENKADNLASHLETPHASVLMSEIKKRCSDESSRVVYNVLRSIELIEQDKKENRTPISADSVAEILEWAPDGLTKLIKEVTGIKRLTANTFMKWLES